MFGNKQQAINAPERSLEIEQLKHENRMKIAELENNHKLALKEKEFELKHFKDEELKTLQEELSNAKKEIAVLEKENEMLVKITNLNADIIDVKDLVGKLINKLPEVNLSNLTINAPTK